MNRKRVAVAMGGPSAEREVSLRSGGAVLRSMDLNLYEPMPLEWRADGLWNYNHRSGLGAADAAAELLKSRADVVFIALHGPGGEDGTIQGFLEILKIPYTGPRVAASAFAMDKIATRAMLRDAGLPCPRAVQFDAAAWVRDRTILLKSIADLGRPVFVKAPTQGSSFGVTRVANHNQSELEKAVADALRFGNRVLVETGIAGIEVTAPTLGNARGGELLSLLPVEIRPRAKDYFDYHEKYSPDGALELCPPESLSAEQIADVQRLGRESHLALQCDGMSRTDMIVTNDGIFILEVNTIPGLTERSLLPRAAAASGIPFSLLITKIIEFALSRDHL
ncbi:MAG: D-alanine--D-alanine ligase [Planctomycetes bacterium]|nr:D-alanine--D-alanine ligase [Planctomycetota bacterium]